jgi:ubiquinone/menaquinone biosynthesis C-methylase UbiE
MLPNKHYELQKSRFRIKREFAKNDVAIHVGKPTRKWEINNVRKIIKNKKLICDLGSGICKFIFEVINIYKGYTVVGIDCSTDLLMEAKDRYTKGFAGKNNLVLLEANYHDLPVFDELFDCVILRFAIHHSDNPEKLIAESYRILKPGGKLIVIEVENFKDKSAYDFFNKMNRVREPSDFRFYSRSQYINLLKKKFNKRIKIESKKYKLPLEKWLSYYEDPEKTLRMFLNAENRVKKEFCLKGKDIEHTIRLNNLLIIATK